MSDTKKSYVETEKQSTKLVEKNFVNVGVVLSKRFKIVQNIGCGSYGQVYKAEDVKNNNRIVAVKVEALDSHKEDTLSEANILRSLQHSRHVAKLHSCGVFDEFAYTAMELLGPDLSNLKEMCKEKRPRLSIYCAATVMADCIEAVAEFHSIGCIHGDIKPSNFCIGMNENRRNIYIIDFGSVSKYVANGQHIKEVSVKHFHGTARYSSSRSLRTTLKDGNFVYPNLSRRDDMFMLFYSYAELLFGKLSWAYLNKKSSIADEKLNFELKLLENDSIQPGLARMLKLITGLNFESIPMYEDILHSVKSDFVNGEGKVYDWESENCKIYKHFVVES